MADNANCLADFIITIKYDCILIQLLCVSEKRVWGTIRPEFPTLNAVPYKGIYSIDLLEILSIFFNLVDQQKSVYYVKFKENNVLFY